MRPGVEINSGSKTPELLIYIPCHTDYEMALSNIRKIQRQAAEISKASNQVQITIKTAISINGADLSKDEIEKYKKAVDYFYYFKESIGGDSNITQGFMVALQKRPSYFWNLSANEILKNDSISNITNAILANPTADIIITNSKRREREFQIRNIFLDLPEGLGLGLISGVVYNFPKMEFAFPAAAKFSWTGWGQLGVLQVACSKLGFLEVYEFPDSKIHEKPFTFIDSNQNQSTQISEYEVVRSNYQHSFFGMPIIVASLFSRNPKIRKKITSKWVKSNWFKINYFSQGVDLNINRSLPHFDTHWIRRMSLPLLFKVNFQISILSFISTYLPIENFRNIKYFKRLLEKVRR